MDELLSIESMKYIVGRLIKNACEAANEANADKSDLFAAGRQVAYYEMLDILRSELLIADQDLKEFGLDFNLESTML